ncbi:hypothetical protein AGIG_G7741 [Arapaima gigas]
MSQLRDRQLKSSSDGIRLETPRLPVEQTPVQPPETFKSRLNAKPPPAPGVHHYHPHYTHSRKHQGRAHRRLRFTART